MSEEIKDLLETLVFMERNNLDHLIRTGQAIKWRKGIEQLQQENKELKEQLKINNQAFNFNVKTIKKHNKENNILTEFEKWLEEDIKNEIEHPIPEIYHDCERCKTIILDKLQELKKEGKK